MKHKKLQNSLPLTTKSGFRPCSPLLGHHAPTTKSHPAYNASLLPEKSNPISRAEVDPAIEGSSFDFGALLYASTLEEIVVARQNTTGNDHGQLSDKPADSPPRAHIKRLMSSNSRLPHPPSSLHAAPSSITPAISEQSVSSFCPPTDKAVAISADKAWRLAKEKRGAARKKLRLKGSSSQGHLTANPKIVGRWLAAALPWSQAPNDLSANKEFSAKSEFSATAMPHAKTGYLGLAEGNAPTDFGLEELVGEGSKYGFQLRSFGG